MPDGSTTLPGRLPRATRGRAHALTRVGLVLATALCLSAPVTARAGAIDSTVVGRIVDETTGEPFSGNVELWDYVYVSRGTTGEDGRFWRKERAGDYEVVVIRSVVTPAATSSLSMRTEVFSGGIDCDLHDVLVPSLHPQVVRVLDGAGTPLEGVHLTATGPSAGFVDEHPTATEDMECGWYHAPLGWATAVYTLEAWSTGGAFEYEAPEAGTLPEGTATATLPDESVATVDLASAVPGDGGWDLVLDDVTAAAPDPALDLWADDFPRHDRTTLHWTSTASGHATAVVTGYTVRDTTTGRVWTVSRGQHWRLRIDGLEPGEHTFELTADSAAGSSPAVTQTVEVVRPIDRVRGLQKTVTGRRAVVTWARPDLQGHTLRRYQYRISRRVPAADRTLTGRRLVLRHLEPGAYRVRVRAYGGPNVPASVWSRPVRFSVG
ncbi:fibronectin type III domain-containing protein [Nocardioides sp. GY 10127]|uniref:fibronectin type III domain-containing protein n=1 Tax=Nocardioides sp. GY 10127 TaxID=2569762 RepID=UPI0010A82C74|nr:fibronectin type III domain-containing protein [Nocardioides sp. GY 10127]TIC82716.1 fibronectin type III domain-containing protein [Nocardioides sp. GY 10127]